MAGSSGPLEVRVVTPRLQTDFAVKRTTTGKQLFRQVVDIFDLHEGWLFGLQFADQDDKLVWLQPEERLTTRALHKQWPLYFTFCVRFWPQESAWTLGDVATELMFLQVRSAVLDNSLFCPLAAAIELAAYALQALCGDFIDARLERGQLTRNRHLPQKLEGPLRGSTEWQERVAAVHRRLHGVPRREAMHEYLDRAQRLPGYGTTFSNIRCENPLGGQPVGRRVRWFWMGVTPFGINVYEDKLIPLLRIAWEQCHSIRYDRCKFSIKMRDREKFQFFTRSLKQSEELFSDIAGQKRAITFQAKKREGEGLSSASSGDVPLHGAAEDGDWLNWRGRDDGVKEEMRQDASESPSWEESLAAAGWLHVVQKWRHREMKLSDGGTSLSETASSVSCLAEQSLDFGSASWSDSTSASEVMSADTEPAHPRTARPSATSHESVQFRLSITSDEVFT